MLDLKRKRHVTKMTAKELEAGLEEPEEYGDGFSSEVNTKELYDSDNKGNMGEKEEMHNNG